MNDVRRLALVAVLAAALSFLVACGHAETPMEPWFVESQEHTIALTEQWKDAIKIRGTGSFTVREGLPGTSPMMPWLEPVMGEDPDVPSVDSGYTLAVGGGGIEMPEGSGRYYLVLPMGAFSPGAEAPMECSGRAFVGQVAECGGWVIRVTDADGEGGEVELLSYPKIHGYKLTWGEIGPVEDEVPKVDDATP